MQVYGLSFLDGMIFQKKELYELFLSVQEIDFGKKVDARLCGDTQTVEAFRISSAGMKVFGGIYIFNENTLVGFLSQKSGQVRIEKEEDEYVGYIDLYERDSECVDLDSFVVLKGQSEQFLVENYLRLVGLENKVKVVSEPFAGVYVDLNKADQIDKERSLVVVLKDQQMAESFLEICRRKGLVPGIAISYDLQELQRLRKMGFEFFVVSFERDCRSLVEQVRKNLGGSVLVAKGLSILSAAGLVDGLIVEKPAELREFVTYSSICRAVRPYVELLTFDEKLLKLCGALKIGVIFDGNFEKVDYARFSSIKRISENAFEIFYLDRDNIYRKLILSNELLEVESEPTVRLVKKVKIREDGRSFSFYSEG
ncbi:hypothetical protein ACSFC1_02485 [Pseudothermotoga sp. U03pept]|uniref:hypothetical protein n=1 Tax=Pseudothermotoga sp. U03pept TaxID=3447012 RepID=UPI003F0DFFFC